MNFIGRYGGDEFIIIAELNSDEEAKELCNAISGTLEEICRKDKVPYKLTFSFGFVKYDRQMKSIQDFIDAADQKLYESKVRNFRAGKVS